MLTWLLQFIQDFPKQEYKQWWCMEVGLETVEDNKRFSSLTEVSRSLCEC